MLGAPPSDVDILALHPEPAHIFSLWQLFIENVNPVTKVVHVPTLQQQILKAAFDLHSTSSAMHALMFSIYAMAVTSLGDPHCEQNYGQDKATLLARFHEGTRTALRQAQLFRTTDITVLQALILHLVSRRISV